MKTQQANSLQSMRSMLSQWRKRQRTNAKADEPKQTLWRELSAAALALPEKKFIRHHD